MFPQFRKPKTYGAILKAKDYYALVQGRCTGKWSFPKGHSNEGENSMDCTIREVAEETGIDILPSPIEYREVGYGNYYVFVLNDKIPLIPRDLKEIMATKWVTLEEMDTLDLNSDARTYKRQIKSDK
jgi:8-oxo-dGTP pyrophosphatase MutT (NUDIX family)